jgi:hypothetical protein
MMIRTLLAAAIGAVVIGAATTVSLPQSRAAPYLSCYTNADGACIAEPTSASTAPSGATAHCNDGDWSFSTHIPGTCSGHNGVDYWITRPPS